MPFVTIAIVAINVVVYLLAIRHGGSFLGGPSDEVAVRYGAIPYAFTHPASHCALVLQEAAPAAGASVLCPARAGVPALTTSLPPWEAAFTAMFMHGSFLHIFGNMLFLAIFGPTVEDTMGSARFVVFYLVGGLVALATQVAVSPDSAVPTIGASGAIAAVLGGYILLYPRARILTLVFIIFFVTLVELPALLLLGLWFLEQLYFATAGLSGPVGGGEGVAYFAHIGGFVFGLISIRAFARRRPRQPPRLAY